MLKRLRLIPITILAAALLFGLKIVDIWHNVRDPGVVKVARAQDNKAQQPAAQPAAKPNDPKAADPKSGDPKGGDPRAGDPKAADAKPGDGKAGPASMGIAALAGRDPTTFTKAELELLENLSQRRDALEQRIREFDLRENLLNAAEKRIEERVAELKKLEASIQTLIRQKDENEEKNLKTLVKVYENMKPKDAAKIFEKLEMPILLGVVERMKEAKLASVLAELNPDRAQQITVELATRRQIPGTSPAAGARPQG